jgi:thiamine-phosphate pyrophosphorylase
MEFFRNLFRPALQTFIEPGTAAMNKPILCYVTDRKALPAPGGALLECIARAARAGVDWIQLREKDLDGRALFDLAGKAISACAVSSPDGKNPVRLLINDRLDVAWTARQTDGGGVHLGENSVPVGTVSVWRSRIGGKNFLIGSSCHSPEAAEQAAAAGADYIFFGPVYATPSKQAFGAPQGLQKLEQVCRNISIPVLAIGGITAENAGACLEAGAAGIAAIRMFQEAMDLTGLLRQIRA